MKEDPEIWFILLEKQLQLSGITADNIKFEYLIAALGANILKQIREILLNPSSTDKYNTFKKNCNWSLQQ